MKTTRTMHIIKETSRNLSGSLFFNHTQAPHRATRAFCNGACAASAVLACRTFVARCRASGQRFEAAAALHARAGAGAAVMARRATDARGSDVSAVVAGGAQGACGRACIAVLPPGALAIRAVLAYLVVARLGGASFAHVAVRMHGAIHAVIAV